MNSAQRAEQVNQERIATYGDPVFSMGQIGKHWGAIVRTFLQNRLPNGAIENIPDLPAHIVATMLMALKIHRMSTPFARKDNDDYVDLRNYASYAEQSNPFIPQQRQYEATVDSRMRPEHFSGKETGRTSCESPNQATTASAADLDAYDRRMSGLLNAARIHEKMPGIPVFGSLEDAIEHFLNTQGRSEVYIVKPPQEATGSSPEQATSEPETKEGREAMGVMIARSVMDMAVSIAKQNLSGFVIEYRIVEAENLEPAKTSKS